MLDSVSKGVVMETHSGAKCGTAEESVKVTTEKYCDEETIVHVGPAVNIGDKCVIDGDVNTSTVFNIKFYFKGACNSFNLFFLSQKISCVNWKLFCSSFQKYFFKEPET